MSSTTNDTINETSVLKKFDNNYEYTPRKCKDILRILSAMHKSFNSLLQIKSVVNEIDGRTSSSFLYNINLKKILDNMKLEKSPLTKKNVKDFLIQDGEGLLVWVCTETEAEGSESTGKAYLAQVVNPDDEIERSNIKESLEQAERENKKDKYITKKYKTSFIKHLNKLLAKQAADNAGSGTEYKIENIGELRVLKSDINELTPNANSWMNEEGEYNEENDIIILQVIAKNHAVFQNQQQLTVRGQEVHCHYGPGTKETGRHKIQINLSNCLLVPTHRDTKNIDSYIKDPFTYKEEFDHNINHVQNHDGFHLAKPLFQLVQRSETAYKPLGRPDPQNYNDENPDQTFKATPVIKHQGKLYLGCGCCYDIIPAKEGKKQNSWTKKGFTYQIYDVDHYLNLIYNSLFNLNADGLGFINTCPKCNQAFKSEKVWTPSWDLWMDFIKMAAKLSADENEETLKQKYPWPGNNLPGYSSLKPAGGWRVFSLENVRKEPADTYDERVKDSLEHTNNNRDMNENSNDYKIITGHSSITERKEGFYGQGLTSKERSKWGGGPKEQGVNYKDIEEIPTNRILELIKRDENQDNSLVSQILSRNGPEDEVQPIIDKYTKILEPFGDYSRAIRNIKQLREQEINLKEGKTKMDPTQPTTQKALSSTKTGQQGLSPFMGDGNDDGDGWDDDDAVADYNAYMASKIDRINQIQAVNRHITAMKEQIHMKIDSLKVQDIITYNDSNTELLKKIHDALQEAIQLWKNQTSKAPEQMTIWRTVDSGRIPELDLNMKNILKVHVINRLKNKFMSELPPGTTMHSIMGTRLGLKYTRFTNKLYEMIEKIKRNLDTDCRNLDEELQIINIKIQEMQDDSRYGNEEKNEMRTKAEPIQSLLSMKRRLLRLVNYIFQQLQDTASSQSADIRMKVAQRTMMMTDPNGASLPKLTGKRPRGPGSSSKKGPVKGDHSVLKNLSQPSGKKSLTGYDPRAFCKVCGGYKTRTAPHATMSTPNWYTGRQCRCNNLGFNSGGGKTRKHKKRKKNTRKHKKRRKKTRKHRKRRKKTRNKY